MCTGGLRIGFADRSANRCSGSVQRRNLDLLDKFNGMHLLEHSPEHDLADWIAIYELAAKMRTVAGDVLDIQQETELTQRMFGIGKKGVRQPPAESLLMARRLVERGIRFIQWWYDGWDHYDDLNHKPGEICRATDEPSAGLIKDLMIEDRQV